MNRAAPLLLLVVLVACTPSVYDAPYPLHPVMLPRDDAAHAAPIEWWYYTGHLETDTGEELGLELTFLSVQTATRAKAYVRVYIIAENAEIAKVMAVKAFKRDAERFNGDFPTPAMMRATGVT